MSKEKEALSLIGWQEWMSLPALDVDWIKAKIDTGARTSAMHAYDLKTFIGKDGRERVRFVIHPLQRDNSLSIQAESVVHQWRSVRSSNGKTELRPVILTPITFMGLTWMIELTLTNRDEMGFRMLLGRQAMRGKFAVDSGSSYLGGRGPMPKKKKKKAASSKKSASKKSTAKKKKKPAASNAAQGTSKKPRIKKSGASLRAAAQDAQATQASPRKKSSKKSAKKSTKKSASASKKRTTSSKSSSKQKA